MTLADRLAEAGRRLPGELVGWDPEKIASDPRNIILVYGGDVALFEYEAEGVYSGHYLFVSRGAAAMKTAEKMLSEVFSRGCHTILGLTPVENRAARWMTRKLGFRSRGFVSYDNGVFEAFIRKIDERNLRWL